MPNFGIRRWTTCQAVDEAPAVLVLIFAEEERMFQLLPALIVSAGGGGRLWLLVTNLFETAPSMSLLRVAAAPVFSECGEVTARTCK